MANLTGKWTPKKESIYVRGFGVIKRADFTEEHYKALVKIQGDKKRTHAHLDFIEDGETPEVTPEDKKVDDHEFPVDSKSWTKDRIADFLNDKDIKFDLNDKKAELLALAVPNELWTADQIRGWATAQNITLDGVKDADLLEALSEHLK